MAGRTWLIGTILSFLKPSVSGDCFPHAVPAEQRSLLVSESETFPLGIQTVGNAHGNAVSAAFKILTEEVLGLQVNIFAASLAAVGDRFWSLAGCSFTDSTWDCSNSISKVHVELGEYMEVVKEEELSKVQQLRVGGIIDMVGGTGYSLIEGLHHSGAWTANSTSAALEYFRSYNVFERPLTHTYFSSFNEVNASGLVLPCDAWTTYDTIGIDNYINLTGDVDGLTSEDGALTLRCHDPNWWLAPVCRSNPEDCIPCVTCASWGYAWYIKEIAHKAILWKMPLAVGAGSGCGRDGTFAQISAKYNVLFYYWGPDAMFNDLTPVQLIFPPTNRKEWASNNMRTLRQASALQTLMHRDVNRWAPQIRTFLTQMKWDQADVNSLLGYVGESTDWNGTLAGACQWLKDNDVWKEWIPESTKCLAGQGLYSSISGIYVLHRHEATECRSCPSGHFSKVLSDDLGNTAICSPCSPGYWQSSYASLVCDPCFPGTFMKDAGATECEKCLQGEYQDLQAQTDCSLCRDEETTKVIGATSHADCECKVGYFWQENASLCVPCMEGVACLGGRSAPLQQHGFWVQAEDRDGLLDFKVLRCRPARSCPAGDLGVCAQHREGTACASCALGYRSTSGGPCESCGGGLIVVGILIGLMVILVGAFPLAETRSGYFNQPTRITSSLLIVAAMMGQGIVAMQSLEAISSLDFSWLEPLKSWFGLLSALLLDVDLLGFSCYVASDQVVLMYAAKLLAFPAFALLTWLVFLLTNALAKSLQQGGMLATRSLCSIHALLLVSFYTAISLIVFVPFQCNINPTGIFTLRAHPQVVCGDADHGALLLFAVLGVLFYPVAIWVTLLVITWKYPVWLCSGKGIETLRKFRVIFGRFKPERYYYCLLLTTMNLAVACIPAIFVSSASFQLGSMALVLWTKQVLLCFLWPWREEAANWTDLFLVGGVMMVLNLAGPLLADDGNSVNNLAILLSFAFLCLPASLLIGMIGAVIYRLRPASVYSAFLCHHKASTGALCRYFKLIVKRVDSGAKVFYDADNLLNLSQLFDIVGRDVKCLVVFMSEGLFQSPWCTGEICSAFSANVRMVNIACDGYTPPDYDEVNMILSSWTEDRKNHLKTYGFDEDAVRTAFAFLHRVEAFNLSRTDPLEGQEAVVLQVIDTIFKQKGTPRQSRQSLRVDSFLPSEAGVVQLLVCGASTRTHGEKQPEAVSTCLILQQQLQARLRVPTLLVESKEDVLSASCATWMVILLTHGLLRDSRFGQILIAKPNLKRLVLNDGTFDFPRTTHQARLEQSEEFLGIEEIGDISAAFQSLCTYIALPWTPQGSEALMEQQLQEISLRLGDVEVDSCSASLFLASTRLSPRTTTSYDFDEGEDQEAIDEEVQMAF